MAAKLVTPADTWTVSPDAEAQLGVSTGAPTTNGNGFGGDPRRPLPSADKLRIVRIRGLARLGSGGMDIQGGMIVNTRACRLETRVGAAKEACGRSAPRCSGLSHAHY